MPTKADLAGVDAIEQHEDQLRVYLDDKVSMVWLLGCCCDAHVLLGCCCGVHVLLLGCCCGVDVLL